MLRFDMVPPTMISPPELMRSYCHDPTLQNCELIETIFFIKLLSLEYFIIAPKMS